VYAKKLENLETLRYNGPGGGGAKEYAAQRFEGKRLEGLDLGVTTSMADLEAQLAGWEQKLKEATTSAGAEAAQQMIVELQARIEAQPLALRLGVPEDEVAKVMSTMDELTAKISEDIGAIDWSKMYMPSEGARPTENVERDVEGITNALGKASNAFGTMGQAMQMLDDPSAKVAGIVMSAVANVAQSFSMALAGARDPWSWMAAAVGGTATMISTITAIKSATSGGSYAEGGMVRGGAFTGDAVPIMANAGEVVLNAAQQGNLAGQLQPREMGGEMQPYTSGEMLFLGLSNYLKRSGRGELVTSRRGER
jgi:hypothetical protein